MKKKLNCILLIDDSAPDNRYHQIVIEAMNITNKIQVAINGQEALDFLKETSQNPPDLIFLDINMPKMNGWEFLEAYKDLEEKQKAKITIVMLTTSLNPEDKKRAEGIDDVDGFINKPLTEEVIVEVLNLLYNK